MSDLPETPEPVLLHGPKDNIWGRHIEWHDFNQRSVWGHWPRRFADGAIFAWSMASGRAALFRLRNIEWKHDPSDMFFATAEDVGYADEHSEIALPTLRNAMEQSR